MTAEPVLEARQLRKTYQSEGERVEAVRSLDFVLHRGELVAVVGPSGCGKSTFLHLLGGLARSTGGEVLVDGQELSGLSDAALADVRRRRVGFIFQAFNLVDALSAEENIALPAVIAGVGRDVYEPRVRDLLKAVGLTERAGRRPAHLSRGEQQRVAIARALIMDPAVVLADEPTGSLDSATGQAILALLRRLHSDGHSIMIVTHDIKIASLAERVLFMRDGTIVNEARPSDDLGGPSALSRLLDLQDD